MDAENIKSIIDDLFEECSQLARRLGIKLLYWIWHEKQPPLTTSQHDPNPPKQHKILFVLRILHLTSHPVAPGYATVPVKNNVNISESLTAKCPTNIFLSPTKATRTLDKLLRLSAQKLRYPAQQNQDPRKILIQIDRHVTLHLIAALRMEGSEVLLVASPHDNDAFVDSDVVWRVCHATIERRLFDKIKEADGGAREKAIGALETLFAEDEVLNVVTRLQIRSVVLSVTDVEIDGTQRWHKLAIARIVTLVLESLEKSCDVGALYSFFDPFWNFWQGFDEDLFDKMKRKIKRIIRSDVINIKLI